MNEAAAKSAADLISDRMRSDFDRTLPERAARVVDAAVQIMYPGHYFSSASVECRELYANGHFIGCISLAQALAEALSRFIAEHHKGRHQKQFKARCDYLLRDGAISKEIRDAFLRIHADDRHDFHHLNKEVPVDRANLLDRAKECINSLNLIEAELFDHQIIKGQSHLTHTEYWPSAGNGTVSVQMMNWGILLPEKYRKVG